MAIIRQSRPAHVPIIKAVNVNFHQGQVRVIRRASQGGMDVQIPPETSRVVAHAVFARVGPGAL